MKSPMQVLQYAGIDAAPTTHAEYAENWNRLRELVKALSSMEMGMRKALFESSFPDPKEGANKITLEDGRKLTGTYKINRTIDETQIESARAEYERLNDVEDAFDDLLKVKHSLVISAFRKLSDPALVAVSPMIIAKPGAPDIKLG